MVSNFSKSLIEVLSLNSYRRALWIFLGLASLLIVVESQTQFIEYYYLNQQADLIAKIPSQAMSVESSEKIESFRFSILADFELLRQKQDRPVSNLFEFLFLFLKGTWILLPIVFLGLKTVKVVVAQAPAEQKTHTIWFGILGFSTIAWVSTIFGFVSILFNRGNGFFTSWFVFPVCSLIVLSVVFCWFALLKAMVPEKKG
ncbi:hypothetical protein SAMN05660420_01461 [Desulfuromusa kysingii]|uniref:Uncharacterized protein n=1 Tax=Desulfuromusa kysingii TaxID=37625 RepID=A0A1H3YZV8_9BACT|nr:hypothetical protein [Desulfuromusa kysingii]SEA16960.1 hypothetical protein SAMN05660420_01461 [Desulfuromusa kysingii]